MNTYNRYQSSEGNPILDAMMAADRANAMEQAAQEAHRAALEQEKIARQDIAIRSRKLQEDITTNEEARAAAARLQATREGTVENIENINYRTERLMAPKRSYNEFLNEGDRDANRETYEAWAAEPQQETTRRVYQNPYMPEEATQVLLQNLREGRANVGDVEGYLKASYAAQAAAKGSEPKLKTTIAHNDGTYTAVYEDGSEKRMTARQVSEEQLAYTKNMAEVSGKLYQTIVESGDKAPSVLKDIDKLIEIVKTVKTGPLEENSQAMRNLLVNYGWDKKDLEKLSNVQLFDAITKRLALSERQKYMTGATSDQDVKTLLSTAAGMGKTNAANLELLMASKRIFEREVEKSRTAKKLARKYNGFTLEAQQELEAAMQEYDKPKTKGGQKKAGPTTQGFLDHVGKGGK